MKFNFKKIATAAASLAMVGSTIALAGAAFPTPFVENGNADVAIVYGNSLDLSAVTDITTALNTALASQSGDGGSGDPTGGDFVQLKKASDELNLGNAWTVVGATLNDDDLSNILADGTYLDEDNEESDFTQKITLGAPSLSHFADTDYNDEEPTIGFQLADNTFLLNYTLDFTSDPDSDVSGGDLVDFESTSINMLGKEYFIFDFDNSTLDITMLDAANSATIEEGETVTIIAEGKTYDVSIAFIDSTEVKLIVNGEETNSLGERETQKLSDGSHVGVQDILSQDYAGGRQLVEISIGAGKIFLDNGGQIELNDDDIKDLKTYVTRGSASGNQEKIDKIVIEWINDDEEFLTPEQDLVMPGLGAIKFSMNDFITQHEETIIVQNDGDDSIEFRAPIEDGDAVFNLLYANASGEWEGLGKSSSKRLVTSATSTLVFNDTRGDEWFVASWASGSDSESYLLRVTSIGEVDNENKTTVENAVTGDTFDDKEANDDIEIGSATITVSSVYDVGSNEWVTFTAGSGVNFTTLYTKEGLKFTLPYEASNTNTTGGNTGDGAIRFALDAATSSAGHNADSFWFFAHEEDKDDDVAQGVKFNVTLDDNSDGEVQISQVNNAGTGGANGREIGNTNAYEAYIVSDLATRIVHDTDPDQDSVEITYWGSEAFAEVFVTEQGATSGGTTELGNVAITDEDLASSGMQTKNLIIVGGPCINTAAAEVLGVPSPTCGDAWTAATGAGDGTWIVETFANPWSGDNIAVFVGGTEGGDTSNAATAFTTLDTITLKVGDKFTGTTDSVATPVVESN